MIDLKKRSALQVAALSVVAATALVACGKKEEAKPAAAASAPKADPRRSPSPM